LYVTETNFGDTGRLLKFDGVTGAPLGPVGSLNLRWASSPVWDSEGNIYVTERVGNTLLKLNGTTGELLQTLASGGILSGPEYLAIGPDGNVYVSAIFHNSVQKYDPTTGAFLGYAIAPTAGLNLPHGIAFTPSSVAGNLISGNNSSGIVVSGAGTTDTVIAGNLIGTDADGKLGLANAGDGVLINAGAKNNTVGGLTTEARNLISGNSGRGISIAGTETKGNKVVGNYIGLDRSGRVPLGNAGDGVNISTGASDNRIEHNVISASRRGNGVYIQDENTTGNVVAGNYIGTDADGSADPRFGNGLEMHWPAVAGGWGVIIAWGSSNNTVGTDGDGIADAAEHNVISGNAMNGILINTSSDNVVAGNYVGTDAAGAAALPNGGAGIILLNASNNRIGSAGNILVAAAERNVISGNAQAGIGIVDSANNVVAGNYIGLDAHGGLLGNGNGFEGISLAGNSHGNRIGAASAATGEAERNVISGNALAGISLGRTDWIVLSLAGNATVGNSIAGNYIGTDPSGLILAPNGQGILIEGGASENSIGNPSLGLGNLITGNSGNGVTVLGADSTGNAIRANAIFNNGGLGIDLGGDGVTPNDLLDVDVGANKLQNYPLIALTAPGAQTRVIGTLHSLRDTTFTLDFYASTAADLSGFGEGQRWLGAYSVMTDRDGNVLYNVLLDAATVPTEFITLTATDAAGNTSEFSLARPVNSPPIANVGGPYSIFEGDSLTLDASGSSDPDLNALTYSWDINGDGVFGDATGASPTLTWSQLNQLGIVDGPTSWQVAVRVSDGFAPPVTSGLATLTIRNVVPTPIISGAPTDIHPGTAIVLTGSATDPSPADAAAGLSLTWQVFGPNGQVAAVGSGSTLTFVPRDLGTYGFSLTAADKDQAVSSLMFTTEANGTRLGTIDAVHRDIAAFGAGQTWATAVGTDGTLYTLFNGFSGNARLASVDRASGALMPIGSGIGASMIALEAATDGMLYGVGYDTRLLYRIDPSTGIATAVGNTGISGIMDLAFDSTGALYATTSNRLWTVNLASGATALVGTITGVASGAVMGIMFDAQDTLFATAYVANSPLYQIDRATLAATAVGPSGFDSPHGGDFDGSVIYTTHRGGTRLGIIDPVRHDVGSFGTVATYAAAFDAGGELYTLFEGFSDNARLAKVDRATGSLTPIGPGIGTSMISLAGGPKGTLYGIGYTNHILYRIDTLTGSAAPIGDTGIVVAMDLAANGAGTLYATTGNKLWTVDPATGAATLVGSITGVQTGEVMGIAFDALDRLFATTYTADAPLYEIDLATLKAIPAGPTRFDRPHGGDIFSRSTTTASIAVTNEAPTVVAPVDQVAFGGAASSFELGSFRDSDSTTGPWTVHINWGDGSPVTTFTTATPGTIAAQSHIYAKGQPPATVTVSVTDEDGAVGSGTFTVRTLTSSVSGTALVKDINLATMSSDPSSMVNVSGTYYFTADDGIHGRELWKTDGTTAGTLLVKDISPGSAGSKPAELVSVNGTLYFTANNGRNGRELWKSDGTAAGTLLIKNLNAEAGWNFEPSYLTNFNGALYFRAFDAATGWELWRSNGTAAGTGRVLDISPGNYSSSPTDLLVADILKISGTIFNPIETWTKTLFFVTQGGLWKSDGSAAGTVRVLNTGGVGIPPSHLTNVRGTLFFVAQDSTHGRELWKFDGTAGSAQLVRDIRVGTSGSNPSNLTNVAGSLFFTADDGVHGAELWRTSWTGGSTVLVKDVYPGGSSFPTDLTDVNGTLFFAAYDPAHGRELWKSNGTDTGTVLVQDLNPGSANSSLSNLLNVDGTLFFAAYDPAHGRELRMSNGTSAGTLLVKDILAGSGSAAPLELADLGGSLYFSADNGVLGRELWKSNGTAAGTVLVRNIQAGTANSRPLYLTNVNGTLFFTASDPTNRTGLWKTDGTRAGTTLLKADVLSGNYDPNGTARLLANVNGTLYFPVGRQLWKSDGTRNGTVLVEDISGSGPTDLTNVNGMLFFTTTDGLWKSDGTADGTTRVVSANRLSNLTVVNGIPYFTTESGDLWKSDGTPEGTTYLSSGAHHLVNVNGTLYFDKWSAIWKSDGTPEGTIPVKVLSPGLVNIENLAAAGGVLYFTANYLHGVGELWKSDGTADGTFPIAFLPSYNLTDVNGILYFTAADSVHGSELWKSDGTAAGTVLVKDINPGVAGSGPWNLTSVSGILYFTATDSVNGSELWRSDGTAAGTLLVSNINPGSFDATPAQLTDLNGTLFFSAYHPNVGIELWKGPTTRYVTQAANDAEAQAVIAAVNRIPAQRNPFVVELRLAAGTFTDIVARPPSGVTLLIKGAGGDTTVIMGHSPALAVESGRVIVEDVMLMTDSVSPTVVVEGGSLVVRNSMIMETPFGTEAAISVAGGSVDLGAADDPGGNMIETGGDGLLIANASGSEISAVGNMFQSDGVMIESQYRIGDRIVDGLDADGSGLVYLAPDTVFVSNSGDLQRAVDAAIAGSTVNVEAGAESAGTVDKPITVAFEGGPTMALVEHDGVLDLAVTGTPAPDNIHLAAGSAADEVVVAMNGFSGIAFLATGQVVVRGGDGDDSIAVAGVNALVDGGAGNDQIAAGASSNLIVVAADNDQFIDDGGMTTDVSSLPPQVFNDSYTIPVRGLLTVADRGVLANDVVDNGGPLTAILEESPAHGTLSFNADGSFTFAADDFVGHVIFSYRTRAADGTWSLAATVTITVTAVPLLIADASTVNVTVGETATNSGAFVDLGATGAMTLFASVGTVLQSLLGDGTWTWSLDTSDGPRHETVVITAVDGQGGVATTEFQLAVDPPPIQISGRIFDDRNNDGAFDTSLDSGLPGVLLHLFDEGDPLTPLASTTTDSAGRYVFNGLLPSVYRIVEVQPGDLFDGKETAGGLGGEVDNSQDSNAIRSILVPVGAANSDGYNFAEILPSRLHGLVWEDFNDDGAVDFGEQPLEEVLMELTGLDDRGNLVHLMTLTDADGVYSFADLRPSGPDGYVLREHQPAGHPDGKDILGEINAMAAGLVVANDTFSGLVIPRPGSIAENYNFAERAPVGEALASGQTAGIGFWQNKNGQALIRSLNGGDTATQLGYWLAATLPNLYGAEAGGNNLAGKTNADVAAYFKLLFGRNAKTSAGGGSPKFEAQVLAAALSVYVTNSTLSGNAAAGYGFAVSQYGAGVSTVDVAASGSAFGLPEHSIATVLDLLLAVNLRSSHGQLYDLDHDGDATDPLETHYRTLANDLFAAINETGSR
jgi:ELWxxDGT repeat protein